MFCEIHENMHAYIVVVDTPYFAVADENGAYRIDAPPGEYDVFAWIPGGEAAIGRVSLTEGGGVTLDHTF